jgi:hypothetical protein
MRKAQNPGGYRSRIRKRAMRRAEEQDVETAQREQLGREQDRDFAPQKRPANAHLPIFFAKIRSIKGTTVNLPAKAVNARIALPQAPMRSMCLFREGLDSVMAPTPMAGRPSP